MGEISKAVRDQEAESFSSDDYPEVPPKDIIAYNELRSCADLFRMHRDGVLQIQPDFQRDVVWTPASQTRFIDSLSKQLPIPSMCFAFDSEQEKWIVIDGLQRMSSIIRFLKGSDWTLSSLPDIDPRLSGTSVARIADPESDEHAVFSRIQNLTVPVTVLRCSQKKREHLEYLFTIFHRLNTGGVKLRNQEIRNCIYTGPFNDLLKELDDMKAWRRLNRMQAGKKYRFAKQELLLRTLAFGEAFENYNGHLAKFLNDYMHNHRFDSDAVLADKRDIIKTIVPWVLENVFSRKPPTKLSITLLEAVLVGAYRNVSTLGGTDRAVAKESYRALQTHDEFSDARLREGLSKKPRVHSRLAAAVEAFSV
jgi:uncharacterized protein DUF262